MTFPSLASCAGGDSIINLIGQTKGDDPLYIFLGRSRTTMDGTLSSLHVPSKSDEVFSDPSYAKLRRRRSPATMAPYISYIVRSRSYLISFPTTHRLPMFPLFGSRSGDVQILTRCRGPLQQQMLRTHINTLILGIESMSDLPLTPTLGQLTVSCRPLRD